MAARFIFLDNEGSPTRWDGTRYFAYLEGLRERLSDDLVSLTAKERYVLPSSSELSFWHSEVTQIEATHDLIRVVAKNDYGNRRFEFVYSGVVKVQSTALKLGAMPWLVIQELIIMRGGLLRHTYADIRGHHTTIYARRLTFNESFIQ
jgi:hypothetical protein